MKKPTLNAGASKERDAILAKVRRDLKHLNPTERAVCMALDHLIDWLLTRKRRYDAKPGGLGRGKK